MVDSKVVGSAVKSVASLAALKVEQTAVMWALHSVERWAVELAVVMADSLAY